MRKAVESGMESYDLKCTSITNDYARQRRIYYLLTTIYPIASVACWFNYGKYIFFITLCIAAPVFWFLYKWAFKLTGACPHCGMVLSGISEKGRLICSGCGGAVVAKDGKFWQIRDGTNSRDFSRPGMGRDEFKQPENLATMTPEQFIAKKRKLKRRAWFEFFLWMMFMLTLSALYAWIDGTHEQFATKRLDELTVVQGRYYIREFYQSSAPQYESGLKDFKNGKTIFNGADALCGDKFPCGACVGKPATVWYAVGRGAGGKRWIYQMEIDDEKVCSLEQTNWRVQELNERNRILIPMFDAAVILLAAIISGVISWAYYGTRKKKLLKKEE